MTNFEQVTAIINGKMRDWMADAELHLNKGNKLAGKRARIASVELEKLMKQWRALSTGREQVTE